MLTLALFALSNHVESWLNLSISDAKPLTKSGNIPKFHKKNSSVTVVKPAIGCQHPVERPIRSLLYS